MLKLLYMSVVWKPHNMECTCTLYTYSQKIYFIFSMKINLHYRQHVNFLMEGCKPTWNISTSFFFCRQEFWFARQNLPQCPDCLATCQLRISNRRQRIDPRILLSSRILKKQWRLKFIFKSTDLHFVFGWVLVDYSWLGLKLKLYRFYV